MSKHTPEPWVISGACVAAESDQLNDGFYVAICKGRDQHANARRIVACVNACEGISTEALELKGVIPMSALELQRDELLAALEGVLAVVGDSGGVAGYHLNGDIADWGEFDEINAVYAAIAKAKGGAS